MTTTYKELLQQGVINNKATLGELRLLLTKEISQMNLFDEEEDIIFQQDFN
jgi:hypothetical protein